MRGGLLVLRHGLKKPSKVPYPLRRHPRAEDDIAAIVAYIAAYSPRAAKRFVAAVESELLRLAEHPRIGRLVRAHGANARRYRKWVVPGFWNCIILYRFDEHTVTVANVVHAKKDYTALL